MEKNYNEYKMEKVRRAVYHALAQISNELDASQEEMDMAIDWFQVRFYEDEEE